MPSKDCDAKSRKWSCQAVRELPNYAGPFPLTRPSGRRACGPETHSAFLRRSHHIRTKRTNAAVVVPPASNSRGRRKTLRCVHVWTPRVIHLFPRNPKFRDSRGEVVFLRSGNLDAGEYEAGQLDALAVIIGGIASTVSFRWQDR